MCREEALKLWQLKPELDKVGCKLVCLLHENIPEEVAQFKPEFWPGELYHDTDKAFFAAVGGGKPRAMSLMGLLNPFGKAWKNASRAKTAVSSSNLKGNGLVGGGLLVMKNGEVVYGFQEKNFGDHAPTEDILAAAKN
mmetsp:Transcript_33500/g.73102  ORF Transcript_33500/g.73102 Transcript_33500/m.73102 type:complete len:138 (+) Transcript_33500:2791-3204(+)